MKSTFRDQCLSKLFSRTIHRVAKYAVFLVASAVYAQDLTPRDPMIRAVTLEHGFSVTNGVKQQRLGVTVNLTSFKPPKEPYDVQCFFVAHSDSAKQDFVFNAQRTQASNQRSNHDFIARPMFGETVRWITIPVLGTVAVGSSSQPFSGTLTYSEAILGSKFKGWIIRVLSSGKVVRVESNQRSLKDLAEGKPAFFDAAAEKAEQK